MVRQSSSGSRSRQRKMVRPSSTVAVTVSSVSRSQTSLARISRCSGDVQVEAAAHRQATRLLLHRIAELEPGAVPA